MCRISLGNAPGFGVPDGRVVAISARCSERGTAYRWKVLTGVTRRGAIESARPNQEGAGRAEALPLDPATQAFNRGVLRKTGGSVWLSSPVTRKNTPILPAGPGDRVGPAVPSLFLAL